MNVVISGHETCGLIHDLSEELGLRGHEVTTIAKGQPFFEHKYDFDQYDFPVSFLTKRWGLKRLWRVALQILWEVSPRLHQTIERRMRLGVVESADLYIQVWGGIPFERDVLEALSEHGTPVATFFMGSDIRDYDTFNQQYPLSNWTVPSEYQAVSFRSKLEILRVHERFSDAVFSVPDQMGLALRPYHHLQIPLRLDRFDFHLSGRRVPKVVHAPTVPHVKGTDMIERALDTLRGEGIPFELVSVRNMPHEKLMEVLTDADILVDEIVCHGPGWLSFEAMASGCVVATRYLAESAECFRPPVWAIDEHDIVDRLRILLTDSELRVRLAVEGRQYVEARNSVGHVVDTVLEKIAAPDSRTDYSPDFLRVHYTPRSEDDLKAVNEANLMVSDQHWYESDIAGFKRDGLEF